MSLMNLLLQSGGAVDTVKLGDFTISNFKDGVIVYAGIKFDNDGSVYGLNRDNVYSRITTWLVSGAAGSYYLSRSIFSGSLNADAGAGPIVMSTDRVFSIQRTHRGIKQTILDYEISSDSSGDPIVATGRVTLQAEIGFEGNDPSNPNWIFPP